MNINSTKPPAASGKYLLNHKEVFQYHFTDKESIYITLDLTQLHYYTIVPSIALCRRVTMTVVLHCR